MISSFILVAAILLIGILSYFTSARFGLRSSNGEKMPPHYQKLLHRFQPDKKNAAESDPVDDMSEVADKRVH